MQYILTEDEYQKLLSKADKVSVRSSRVIQELCTKVACHMPVTRSWATERGPTPWGCVRPGSDPRAGYCDECPVQEQCPYADKEYSK